MHYIFEMNNLISSTRSDCNCSGTCLMYFHMSSQADNTFGQSPADEIRAMWGNMVHSSGIDHSSRLGSSVEGNGDVIIIVNLLYSSGINMRID
jgi:hypothetical protein